MKSSIRNVIVAATLCLSASGLLTGCGGQSTDTATSTQPTATTTTEDVTALGGQANADQLDALYQAAVANGETTVYVVGPSEPSRAAYYATFSARYPKIKVVGTQASGPTFDSKIRNEVASGQYQTDLVQGGDTSVAPQLADGLYQAYTPFTTTNLDAIWSEPTGTLWAASGSVSGIVYNTNLVQAADAPKGWADLLNPAFKDKMTMDDPTKFGPTFGTFNKMIQDGRLGDDFVSKLYAQNITLNSQSQAADATVMTGQFAIEPIYPLDFFMTDKANGGPIEWVLPNDGAQISPHYLGLMAHAPHPNAAKLLMNWSFTPEAQQGIASIGLYPLVAGEPGPNGLPSIDTIDLLKPIPLADIASVSATNLAKVKAAWQ